MNPPVPQPPPHDREAALFGAALGKPASERAIFLEGACHGDPALRARLEARLAAHQAAGSPLRDPGATTSAGTATLEFFNAPDEAVGQMLGRYKLLEKLGEGGFGIVWAAEQKEPVKRRVALKIIKLGMDTKQVVARFEAERQALAMMDHPNIAKVLDAGATDTGRPFFVMELVKGVRITDYCDQAGLTTRERLDLFIKVCQAIQHAHQKGIIHRDIKPSNILITEHDGVPVPKVIDFGIAKATQQELTELTIYTQHHQFIGTPAYMSPEQAQMSGLDIDTRSDIYSLGVLLYELLTGSTPFDPKELMASGIDAMRKTIREKEPVRPSTRLTQALVAAEVPGRTGRSAERFASSRRRLQEVVHQLKGDLDWIVMKCLEKDRQRRYETANGLAADLKRHLDNEPVLARPPSAAYRFQKAFRRNKLVFSAATAVAAALVAGIAVSSWQTFAAREAQRETEAARQGEEAQRREAQQKQAEAETERRRADAQARKASESQQQSRRLLYAADMQLAHLALLGNDLGSAVELLGRHTPRPEEEDLRGFEWRYLWEKARGHERLSASFTNSEYQSLAFSPDDRWLAVAGLDGVRIIDLAAWPKEASFLAHTNLPLAVQFSPDGASLLRASHEDVLLWDTLTWQFKRKLPGAAGLAGFSPDGRTLVTDTPNGLQIWDAPSLTLLQELTGQSIRVPWDSVGSNLAFSHDGSRVAAWVEDAADSPRTRSSLRIWQVADLRAKGSSAPVRIIRYPEIGAPISLALSGDGSHVAASTTLGFTRVWDTSTGDLLASGGKPDGSMTGQILYRPDGRTLLGVRTDQTLRSWRPTGTNLVEVGLRLGHLAEVWSLASSRNGTLLATGDRTGVVKLWDASQWDREAEELRLKDAANGHAVQFLSDHRTLVVRDGRANTLSYWDTISGWSRQVSSNVVGWVRFSPDERSVAMTRANGSLEIRSANNDSPPVTIGGHSNGVRFIRFTRDGRQVLTASPKSINNRGDAFLGDRTLRRWDTASGRLLQETNLSSALGAISMAADGETFAVRLELQDVELRRTRDFALVFQTYFRGLSPTVALSPDAQFLAVGSGMGNEIRVWDVSRQAVRFDLRGTDHINALAFSPDGKALASASVNGTVKLWSVETGQELLRLTQHEGVGSVMFSGDGLMLAVTTYRPEGIGTLEAIRLIRAPSFGQNGSREAGVRPAESRR